MSKKCWCQELRNRSAVSVTRITVDIGHTNQVNPYHSRSAKLQQNFQFHFNPRPQNHRSRVANTSRASIAATQPLKHVKTWKNEVINSTKTEQITRKSLNGDDWHAQKLFMNIVDSVIVCTCTVIVLRDQYRCLQSTWSGRATSRVVSGGSRGDLERRFRPVWGGKS